MTTLIYLKECGSTNDEILKYIHAGSNHFSGVYTFNQTNGRGQYGNGWKTSEHKNIALTVAIPENYVKASDSLFNFYTALAVREFAANLTKHEVKIKWPNDLIIGNKKVCGMLIEKKKVLNRQYYIVGIGINVQQENFEDLPRAGSLLTQTGIPFPLTETAEALYNFLICKAKDNPTGQDVLQCYNTFLYRKKEVAVFKKNNSSQNGMISHADELGNIWIELEHDGLQKFYHKEIEMLY